jgi:carbonic anhydrase
MNDEISILFENNRRWADGLKTNDPNFFSNLAKQQSPKYLWIGCSDSRVPANEIIGLLPGEVFVHRNVANLVVHTDLNCLSVIQFAVEVLNVRHIIVCGHYGCGGVAASMEERNHGLIDNWLRHIRDVGEIHADELAKVSGDEARKARMCELNVIQQVSNVCQTTILQKAWHKNLPLSVHGWIYDIHDGILQDLKISLSGEREFKEKFRS